MSYNDFIKRYFSNNFIPPSKKESDLYFTMWSHNKWAINESIRFVGEHSDMKVEDALTLFVYKMKDYSVKARSDATKFMFATAGDMGKDILDTWLAHFE